MNLRILAHFLGNLSMLVGVAMLPSLGIAIYSDGDYSACFLNPVTAFTLSMLVCFMLGIILRFFMGGSCDNEQITASEGFAVTVMGWVVAAFVGCFPYYLILCGQGGFGFIDAYFETMSGFTTTGSSIFGTAVADGGYGLIEALPKSILFWRSLTHWLGGMGIVVLALAVLPALRAGGYQLFMAEVPGPTAERLQPRIRETAAILWGAYCVLTAAEVLLLWFGGMPLFDSLCHTFATMATGGFSTKDASIGFYTQTGHPSALYFEIVFDVFMFLAGCNFLLHYLALHGKIKAYFKDTEFRFYAAVVCIVTLALTLSVYFGNIYADFGESLRQSVFQTLSIMTTTGFATTDTNVWPCGARILLVLIMFFGGCAGSTGGGLKQVRIMVCFKYGIRELKKLLRPQLVNRLRIGKNITLEERAAMGIVGLVILWIAIYAIGTLTIGAIVDHSDGGKRQGITMASQQHKSSDDALVTSASAVAACLNNIGPGLDRVGSTVNYHWFPALAKVFLVFFMLLGRLEIYPILVLLLPLAWRK